MTRRQRTQGTLKLSEGQCIGELGKRDWLVYASIPVPEGQDGLISPLRGSNSHKCANTNRIKKSFLPRFARQVLP